MSESLFQSQEEEQQIAETSRSGAPFISDGSFRLPKRQPSTPEEIKRHNEYLKEAASALDWNARLISLFFFC